MTTALVAVHYQNDVVHPDGKIRAGTGVVETAARLLDGARRRGWPVVSARVVLPEDGGVRNSSMFRRAAEADAVREGTWGAEFHERLQPLAGERVVTHSRINAFYGSELERVLEELGARRVVVASDACAAGDPELHAASLRSLALHVDRVATVDEILA